MRTAVVDVDLVCLSCGRGGMLSVPTLADLPRREACSVCQGSIVATGWTSRVVRKDEPFDWMADRPKVGRPPSRLTARPHPSTQGSEQPA